MAGQDLVEVELVGVRVELPSNTPVVLLREVEGERRSLSIFIGGPEATAIAFALEGVETPRPLTHDLMCDILGSLGVELTSVVITELVGTTFFAELNLQGPDSAHLVSSRPSDAVALAARAGCPIYARRTLVDEVGFVDEVDIEADDASVNPEEVVEEFRNFIDNVSPDDFAS